MAESAVKLVNVAESALIVPVTVAPYIVVANLELLLWCNVTAPPDKAVNWLLDYLNYLLN